MTLSSIGKAKGRVKFIEFDLNCFLGPILGYKCVRNLPEWYFSLWTHIPIWDQNTTIFIISSIRYQMSGFWIFIKIILIHISLFYCGPKFGYKLGPNIQDQISWFTIWTHLYPKIGPKKQFRSNSINFTLPLAFPIDDKVI